MKISVKDTRKISEKNAVNDSRTSVCSIVMKEGKTFCVIKKSKAFRSYLYFLRVKDNSREAEMMMKLLKAF